jgi:hypothetical protein
VSTASRFSASSQLAIQSRIPTTPNPLTDDALVSHLQSIVVVGEDYVWPGFLARTDEYPLARQCLHSLANIMFGFSHNAPEVATRGTSLYVRSLSHLNQNLGSHEGAQSDDNILAVMILSLYEMLVYSSEAAWVAHAAGLGQLVQLRGSDAFSDPFQLELFEGNRFILLLASLVTSQATFLSEDIWKTRPWKQNPAAKGQIHHLLDIFADLITLKAALVTSLYPETFRAALMQAIAGLRDWRRLWNQVNSPKVKEVSNPNPGAPACLSTILHFTSTHTADNMCIYDAILIQAIRLLVMTGTDLPIELVQELQAAGLEICRSVDYQLAESARMTGSGLTGQFLLLFPLTMASLALHANETLSRFIKETLNTFTGSSSTQKWGIARLASRKGNVG